MAIQKIEDCSFGAYGRIIDVKTSEIVAYLNEKTPTPEAGNIYVAGEDAFYAVSQVKDIEKICFGELAMQAGYCNGRGNSLDGLEYHTSSEIIVAGTDMALILGKRQDIKDCKYETSKCEIFEVKKYTCLELFATTLHYAPCKVGEYFKAAIFLPLGTNTPLKNEHEDKMLAANNKWLLVHAENTGAIADGAVCGLIGENIRV